MVQNLQPVGTVEWDENVGDPWDVAIAVNEELEDPFIVEVLFGGDRIVYETEDGEWEHLAHLEDEEMYFYDRTDEFANESSDYFVVDVPGEDGRDLFIERDD